MTEQQTSRLHDPERSVEERVEDIVSQLSLEEKASQMIDVAMGVPRLGIPPYNWWNECLHGVARAGCATVFPQAIGMAASFNSDLMYETADAISDEARAKHHEALRQGRHSQYFGLTYWSPNINIFRDPRWGRGHETYGEDPYLTSRMGVAFVKGLQGDDEHYFKVVATPKHYAVHSGPESKRHHFDAQASQRDMAETYLPAFKACVQEGKAHSIMGAYNRTNGEPCCASRTLLQQILRETWGFEGFVVSDCGAINDIHENHRVTSSAAESAALAVKNGCELNCGRTYPDLVEACKLGLISEAEIDCALRRLFTARIRLGMFDPPEKVPYAGISPDVVNCAEHRRLSRRMARESMVLLKNENDLLPLDKNTERIGIIGPNAMSFTPLLGNYNGFSGTMVTPFEGFVQATSPASCAVHAEGCTLTGGTDEQMKEATGLAENCDVVVAMLGYSPTLEGEEGEVAESDGGGDRMTIDLPGRQEELLRRLYETGTPVVLVLTGGSPVSINWAKENIPAILMAWYPGEEGGHAIAETLFGDYNPGGRLPVTFEKSLDELPPFEDYSMAERTYRYASREPLFHFGHGLSYTTFEYGRTDVSPQSAGSDESITIKTRVKNTGTRAGDEVVQLYVQDVEATVPVPRLHLEGFQRLHLKPGQTRAVTFVLTPRQLACFDEDGNAFVEPGEFRLFIGGGQPGDPDVQTVEKSLKVEKR